MPTRTSGGGRRWEAGGKAGDVAGVQVGARITRAADAIGWRRQHGRVAGESRIYTWPLSATVERLHGERNLEGITRACEGVHRQSTEMAALIVAFIVFVLSIFLCTNSPRHHVGPLLPNEIK